MGEKGAQTREFIKQRSRALFAERGFQAVTMKDICESCGLSRGGLYRHYGSTRQIFEEILQDMTELDRDFLCQGMEQERPAAEILKKELAKLEDEMKTPETSLSYAIYEYSVLCDDHIILELNRKAAARWKSFLEYGIRRKEFRPIDAEQMTDLILYVYQGVRMWSRVIPLPKKTFRNITEKIWADLSAQETLYAKAGGQEQH